MKAPVSILQTLSASSHSGGSGGKGVSGSAHAYRQKARPFCGHAPSWPKDLSLGPTANITILRTYLQTCETLGKGGKNIQTMAGPYT